MSTPPPPEVKTDPLLPRVSHVIAVSSGKGGVGKSTVSTNLAIALSRLGARVGLLDADVYGPDIPIMFGLDDRLMQRDRKLVPNEKYGIRLMSMGFILDPEQPVVWRGPMVGHALTQMLRDVDWGTLDYLVVDMPPGTGDAQLTLTQLVPLSGAILVSTPQVVALADTIKGLMMFVQTKTPILGLVENMSHFICPHCAGSTELFRRGTVAEACTRYDVPYLGDVPFDVEVRKGGDEGTPITVMNPEAPAARAFTAIAERVASALATPQAGAGGTDDPPTPRVVPITRR